MLHCINISVRLHCPLARNGTRHIRPLSPDVAADTYYNCTLDYTGPRAARTNGTRRCVVVRCLTFSPLCTGDLSSASVAVLVDVLVIDFSCNFLVVDVLVVDVLVVDVLVVIRGFIVRRGASRLRIEAWPSCAT